MVNESYIIEGCKETKHSIPLIRPHWEIVFLHGCGAARQSAPRHRICKKPGSAKAFVGSARNTQM